MEDRIITMEETIAFMQRDIETLDGVVRELVGKLEHTTRELARVREDHSERFQEVARALGGGVEGSTDGGAGPASGDASGDAPYRQHMPPHWGRSTGDHGGG
ncbi:MAG: hypothetical protein AB8G96_07440 [Phycisphaerales bacterium]